jgi:nucleoid DNA-binding protein
MTAGEVIELRGLGTFEVRERKAYKAHNPRTLAPVDVPAHRVIFFKPCRKLKNALKGGTPM